MSFDSRDGVDGSQPLPSLETMIQRILRFVDITLRVSMPARVITFDPATRKANLKLELLRIIDVQGEDVPDIPTIIPLVPVRFPRGALGKVEFPILPNDTGHVIFTDRALAAWLQNGNPFAPVDPENGRAHALGDAIFEPGLLTDADAIADPVDMTSTVIDGAALVKIGGLATEFAAKGTSLATAATTANVTLAALGAAAGPDAIVINGIKAAMIAFTASLTSIAAIKAMVE